MKASYKAALEAKADIDRQQPCQQSIADPMKAGPSQGCMQQPHLEASLHAYVPSCNASAQGHLQQPFQMSAPLRSSAHQLQQQGSLPQEPLQPQDSSIQQHNHQGSSLLLGERARHSPVSKPGTAKESAMLQSTAHQHLAANEVCYAQPLLPSPQPQQQHGAKSIGHSQAPTQAPRAVAGQPADRASSSGQVSSQAEGNKTSSQESRHAGHRELHQTTAVGLGADRAVQLPKGAGQGLQTKASERLIAPDKENAETGLNHYNHAKAHYLLGRTIKDQACCRLYLTERLATACMQSHCWHTMAMSIRQVVLLPSC